MFHAHFSLRENQDVWVLSFHVVLESLDGFNLHNTRPPCVISSHLLMARSQTADIPSCDTRRAINARRKRDLGGKDFVRWLPIWSKARRLLGRVWRGDFCLLCLFGPNGLFAVRYRIDLPFA